MVSCPQCSTPAPTSESRFCDRCGTALPAPGPTTLACEVCGRPYKTERGLRAHMATVHAGPEAAPGEDVRTPWQPDAPSDEEIRTPWLAPPVQGPPRAVPGASSADLPTQATPAPPPPPAEPFRWSRPATDAAQTAYPAPPQFPERQRYNATQSASPSSSYGAPPAPSAATGARLPPFRTLKELAGIIRLLFLVGVLALLVAAAANVYLGLTVPPSDNVDLFRNVNEKQWIAWAAAGAFAACAYLVIVVWLHRAYRNQLALGTPATRLPPSVVVVLCFVPIVNLVIMTLALREIWRSADLQRNEWAAKARRSSVPSNLNVIWIGPVLAAAAWVAFALVVDDRIGSDGVTSVDDARVLYFGRAVLLFELFWVTLAIRKVFYAVTEQQERAQWHVQLGQGVDGAPAPAHRPEAPTTAYPAVPS